MKTKSIVNLVLYAVALAMGVATVVTSAIGEPMDLSTVSTLLGISVFCLALAGLQNADTRGL